MYQLSRQHALPRTSLATRKTTVIVTILLKSDVLSPICFIAHSWYQEARRGWGLLLVCKRRLCHETGTLHCEFQVKVLFETEEHVLLFPFSGAFTKAFRPKTRTHRTRLTPATSRTWSCCRTARVCSLEAWVCSALGPVREGSVSARGATAA